jgi:hypothetical protein
MLKEEEKISILSKEERMKLAEKAVDSVVGRGRARKKRTVRRARRN